MSVTRRCHSPEPRTPHFLHDLPESVEKFTITILSTSWNRFLSTDFISSPEVLAGKRGICQGKLLEQDLIEDMWPNGWEHFRLCATAVALSPSDISAAAWPKMEIQQQLLPLHPTVQLDLLKSHEKINTPKLVLSYYPPTLTFSIVEINKDVQRAVRTACILPPSNKDKNLFIEHAIREAKTLSHHSSPGHCGISIKRLLFVTVVVAYAWIKYCSHINFQMASHMQHTTENPFMHRRPSDTTGAAQCDWLKG